MTLSMHSRFPMNSAAGQPRGHKTLHSPAPDSFEAKIEVLGRLLINPRYCIADAINFDFLVVKKDTRKVPKTHRDEGEKGAERGHKGVRSHGIVLCHVLQIY